MDLPCGGLLGVCMSHIARHQGVFGSFLAQFWPLGQETGSGQLTAIPGQPQAVL